VPSVKEVSKTPEASTTRWSRKKCGTSLTRLGHSQDGTYQEEKHETRNPRRFRMNWNEALEVMKAGKAVKSDKADPRYYTMSDGLVYENDATGVPSSYNPLGIISSRPVPMLPISALQGNAWHRYQPSNRESVICGFQDVLNRTALLRQKMESLQAALIKGGI
jgi:hypothetical protein